MAQLDALTDIEVAQRLMHEKGGANTLNMNPLDVQYRKLRATITPLESYRTEYKLVAAMLENVRVVVGGVYDVTALDAVG